MRLGMTIGTLALLGLVASLPTADARGHQRGLHGHHGMSGSSGEASRGTFAGDQRHANDDYVKAAAEEEDKLLDSKIKSICRGC
jgi:hypothetical protein